MYSISVLDVAKIASYFHIRCIVRDDSDYSQRRRRDRDTSLQSPLLQFLFISSSLGFWVSVQRRQDTSPKSRTRSVLEMFHIVCDHHKKVAP